MLNIFRSKKKKQEERLWCKLEDEIRALPDDMKEDFAKVLSKYGMDQYRLFHLMAIDMWNVMVPPVGDLKCSNELRDAIRAMWILCGEIDKYKKW